MCTCNENSRTDVHFSSTLNRNFPVKLSLYINKYLYTCHRGVVPYTISTIHYKCVNFAFVNFWYPPDAIINYKAIFASTRYYCSQFVGSF